MTMDDAAIRIFQTILTKYPNLTPIKLGSILMMLGGMRHQLGHEGVIGSLIYAHPDESDLECIDCIDFLLREVLAIKPSKLDTSHWKFCGKVSERNDQQAITNCTNSQPPPL